MDALPLIKSGFLHILHNLRIHLAYDDEIHFSSLGSFAARRHEALVLDE